jgi:transposase-like protein
VHAGGRRVRTDGAKELVAVADGLRESTESWAELLRDLRRRGMQAPVLAVGDGGLGLWAALRDVFPATRAQRCWVHQAANVLAALPKGVHPGARRALAELNQAESRDQAVAALEAFAVDYAVKWPKAVAKVTDDAEELLCFFDFPAEHWVHLRTTNPVESMIAICREHAGNVTRWQDGQMALRWCAAGMVEAAKQFRRLNGYLHLPALRTALEAEVAKTVTSPCEDREEVQAA